MGNVRCIVHALVLSQLIDIKERYPSEYIGDEAEGGMATTDPYV